MVDFYDDDTAPSRLFQLMHAPHSMSPKASILSVASVPFWARNQKQANTISEDSALDFSSYYDDDAYCHCLDYIRHLHDSLLLVVDVVTDLDYKSQSEQKYLIVLVHLPNSLQMSFYPSYPYLDAICAVYVLCHEYISNQTYREVLLFLSIASNLIIIRLRVQAAHCFLEKNLDCEVDLVNF